MHKYALISKNQKICKMKFGIYILCIMNGIFTWPCYEFKSAKKYNMRMLEIPNSINDIWWNIDIRVIIQKYFKYTWV